MAIILCCGHIMRRANDEEDVRTGGGGPCTLSLFYFVLYSAKALHSADHRSGEAQTLCRVKTFNNLGALLINQNKMQT